MNIQRGHISFFSILGGFLGAALFQVVLIGVNVEAEESPTAVLDSISVKQFNLYNHKNEVVAKLTSDSFGLPKFEMGRNDLSRIDFGFVTENQPAITPVCSPARRSTRCCRACTTRRPCIPPGPRPGWSSPTRCRTRKAPCPCSLQSHKCKGNQRWRNGHSP